MQINSAKLIIEILDESTGELFTREATLGDFKETKKASSTTRTKKPKDTDPVPKIELLDNKLVLNAAAVELTGFEPENKILIQFEKKGRVITPLIKVDDKGNRLTKTYTVSFRGQQHDTLAEYGTVFELSTTEREGVFKMVGDKPLPEDDIIDVPEELNTSDDLDNVIDENFDFSFDD